MATEVIVPADKIWAALGPGAGQAAYDQTVARLQAYPKNMQYGVLNTIASKAKQATSAAGQPVLNEEQIRKTITEKAAQAGLRPTAQDIDQATRDALAAGGTMAPWATAGQVDAALKGLQEQMQTSTAAAQMGDIGAAAYETIAGLGGQQAELTQAMLDFAERRAAAQERIAASQENRAAEQWNLYKELYLPVEKKFIKAAGAGLIPQEEAERAAAGVRQAFSQEAQMFGQQLERMGVDPTSPKYAQTLRNYDIARAAAEAGARNEARRRAVDTNFARQQVAVGIGRGIPSEAASIAASAGPFLTGAGEMLSGAAGNLGSAARTIGLGAELQLQSMQPAWQSSENALNRSLQQQIAQMQTQQPSFFEQLLGQTNIGIRL